MKLKFISIAALAVVAAAAHSQVQLTQISQPNAGNSAFGSTAVTFPTTYSVGTGVATVTVNKTVTGNNKIGTVTGWAYEATAMSGNLGVLTIVDQFTGLVTSKSTMNYTITADLPHSNGTSHAKQFFSGGGSSPAMVFITSLPGWNSITNTLTLTFDLTSVAQPDLKITVNQNFKNIAAVPEPMSVATVGIGLVGLFVRRRRKNA